MQGSIPGGGGIISNDGEKYARYPFLFPDMSGYGGVRVHEGWGGGVESSWWGDTSWGSNKVDIISSRYL